MRWPYTKRSIAWCVWLGWCNLMLRIDVSIQLLVFCVIVIVLVLIGFLNINSYVNCVGTSFHQVRRGYVTMMENRRSNRSYIFKAKSPCILSVVKVWSKKSKFAYQKNILSTRGEGYVLVCKNPRSNRSYNFKGKYTCILSVVNVRSK